ncbi:hypothetical protein [Roseomonas indoligenes]|uniref:hypothetical protein n=1 Tax=Roseomonas indoligenes TaxID=2820811 RepID=UPI001FD7E244|nr:hypothetical protein [Pararoseomonas indoligenes]
MREPMHEHDPGALAVVRNARDDDQPTLAGQGQDRVGRPGSGGEQRRAALVAQGDEVARLDAVHALDWVGLRRLNALLHLAGPVEAQHVAGVFAAIRPGHVPAAVPAQPARHFFPQRLAGLVHVAGQDVLGDPVQALRVSAEGEVALLLQALGVVLRQHLSGRAVLQRDNLGVACLVHRHHVRLALDPDQHVVSRHRVDVEQGRHRRPVLHQLLLGRAVLPVHQPPLEQVGEDDRGLVLPDVAGLPEALCRLVDAEEVHGLPSDAAGLEPCVQALWPPLLVLPVGRGLEHLARRLYLAPPSPVAIAAGQMRAIRPAALAAVADPDRALAVGVDGDGQALLPALAALAVRAPHALRVAGGVALQADAVLAQELGQVVGGAHAAA